jgi:ankyrin repeat protein
LLNINPILPTAILVSLLTALAPAKEIFEIIDANDPATLQAYVEKSPESVKLFNDKRQSPLHRACIAGDPELGRVLLEAGASIDARNGKAATPLMIATRHPKKSEEWLTLLAERGAKLDTSHRTDGTALMMACAAGKADAVKVLLAAGAKPDSGSRKANALTVALHVKKSKRMELCRMLLAAGAKPARYPRRGPNPLTVAVEARNAELVKLLIEHGANVNTGRPSPFQVAMRQSTDMMLVALLEAGQCPLMACKLFPAIQDLTEQTRRARLLLDYGLDPVSGCETNLNAIVGMADFEHVEMYLEAGADIAAADRYGRQAIHHAAGGKGSAEIIVLLVDSGADADAVTPFAKKRPVHFAAARRHGVRGNEPATDFTHLQVIAGFSADLDAADLSGNTPLHLAVRAQNAPAVAFLVSRMVDIAARNKQDLSVVGIALKAEAYHTLVPLVQAGAEVNAEDLKPVFAKIDRRSEVRLAKALLFLLEVPYPALRPELLKVANSTALSPSTRADAIIALHAAGHANAVTMMDLLIDKTSSDAVRQLLDAKRAELKRQ